jgi:hypothetical protein
MAEIVIFGGNSKTENLVSLHVFLDALKESALISGSVVKNMVSHKFERLNKEGLEEIVHELENGFEHINISDIVSD